MLVYKDEYLPNYTYSDYSAWEGDWELIEGVPYAMSPAPTITHQEINLNIGIALKSGLKACRNCKALPEVDWKVDVETVVRPDSLVVCDLPVRGPFLTKTPHIIFEVLSPSTKKKDRQLKFLLYQEQGVAYYIMVDPAGMFAEVYRLENGKYRLEGEFKEQSYLFRIDGCHFDFSFSEVFDLEA